MTTNEKLTAANKRYDGALYNYMMVETSEANRRELKAASAALNKAIDEAEYTGTTLVGKMHVDLITAAGNVNRCADKGDANRNRVNYGIATKCAEVLRMLGVEATFDAWENDGYLRIPKVTINGKVTDYHNGQ